MKRALISVYNQTGLVEFAKTLADEFGVEFVSTGGTARLLIESGLAVMPVEQVTGFPEMMNGRVKSLHPHIHAAILADRANPEHMRQLEVQRIKPIDLVVVNLYPFVETISQAGCTLAEAIEMIDVGGPTLIRAAAKNAAHVWVLSSPDQYKPFLEVLRSKDEDRVKAQRRAFAQAVFELTSAYDGSIQRYLATQAQELIQEPQRQDALSDGRSGSRSGGQVDIRTMTLRYGENPHQQAHYEGEHSGEVGYLWPGCLISETQLSYNNYVDAVAAHELCKELTRELRGADRAAGGSQTHIALFIKHTNSCGVGIGSSPRQAYERAYLGDPNAAMGGILACSFDVTADVADMVMDTYAQWGKEAGVGGFFAEVWLAPRFDIEAFKLIKEKKAWGGRVHLLATGDMSISPVHRATSPAYYDSSSPTHHAHEQRDVGCGLLVQSRDFIGLNKADWRVVTERLPNERELADLRLAWLICKHTKSNAITLCKDGQLLGNGAGQMSRVMSVRIATWLSKDNGHENALPGSVAASDAFFPFPDGPELLMDAGVTAIIQPGGSKRDEETIAACNQRGTAMIMTGVRHFRH